MKDLHRFCVSGDCCPIFAEKTVTDPMNTVVISTSSLNSYGSRVLTSGIDIAQYQRNPVLLYMHRRYSREDAPIGRVENVRVDGDRLLGDLVFDEKDDFGKKVAQKWADGFLRMVSAGLSIVELSDDPIHLLPGQKRMTITKSKLDEVSVVDIGANDDAIALYNEAGGRITLSQGDNSPDLPLLKDSTNPNNKEVMNEKIALALGLSAEATEEQAVSAIALLKAEVDQAKQLKLALINEQLASAVQSGKLPKEQEETYRQIGLTMGAETLRITLSTLSAPQRASSIIRPSAPTDPAKFAKFTDIPTDRLEAFKSENPDEYARLYTDHFGFPPPSLSR